MRFVPVRTTSDMNVFHPAREASVAEHLRKNLSATERPKASCIIWVFSTNRHFDICIFSSSVNGTKIQTEVQI